MSRRTPLSRERVLAAALALVDAEGVEALTMRRLGRELGVEAMSLYGYVDSKDDLIEGVVEQVFREMPLIVPGGPGGWQARLRRHVATYRRVLLAHPNVVRLVARRPLDIEGVAAFVESALAELRSLGLDLETADRVLGVLAGFTLGVVSEQVGVELQGRRSTRYEDIDPARYPNLAAAKPQTSEDFDREFEMGVDFILDGIERLLAARGVPTEEDDEGEAHGGATAGTPVRDAGRAHR
jgi:TetR/AcrR family tetracycline transcriptional repressor